jgi:hypothetical protein
MRTLPLLLTAMLFATTAAEATAQNVATLVGAGTGTVRVAGRTTIPEILNLRQTAQPAATWQAATFTEYTIRYQVATNLRWDLVAFVVPAGVTVLDTRGDWIGEGATIANGTPTNGTEITVRVRIADGAAVTWAQDLRIEARRAF